MSGFYFCEEINGPITISLCQSTYNMCGDVEMFPLGQEEKTYGRFTPTC